MVGDDCLKAIDFFCGAGGMTFGLRQAGIDVVAGIDNDANCRETYERNNPGSEFIEVDIRALSELALSRRLGIEKCEDSLLFACCTPCQYWTKINTNKNGTLQGRDLLREFMRFMSWFKPGYLLVENVPGLFTSGKENVLQTLFDFLTKESYAFDNRIVSAKHFGVPQKRTRFVLAATRISRSIQLPEENPARIPHVRDFIGTHNGFPSVEDGHKDYTDFIHTTASLSDKNRRRIGLTPKDGGTRSSWKNVPELQIEAYRGRDNIFRDVYGRMFWDKPAPTITTRFNSLSNGRFGHPEEPRAISLREGATLQTFPKTYVFRGSSEASIARQIGNAVPPRLAQRLGECVVRSWSDAVLSGKSTSC
ncbi:MAG: DNA cytosine methyltransferase [Candidatus Thermoplasmatota archaeon]|nr:DNA cytosine methyltransferase [Candidatus Thermoplasmatota archaeon]